MLHIFNVQQYLRGFGDKYALLGVPVTHVETRMECQAPGFSLVHLWLLWAFGEETQQREKLCLSTFKISENKF